MKYKKTFDLVDQIISYGIDKAKIESNGLVYDIENLYTWIVVTFTEKHLKIAICRTAGLIARLVYKKENGKYVFDSSLSRNYSKLKRVNENILLPELKRLCRT